MLSLRSVLQERKTSMFVVCSACVLLLMQFRVGSYQSGQRERVIDDVTYSYRECPVKIVGVETGKRQVPLRKPFLDDDDWMKGLTIRIENKSDRVITHVTIAIFFDRPAEQADQPEQPGALWEISHGVSPFDFKSNESMPPPIVRAVQPGETEPIALSGSQYEAMMSFLRDIKFSPIERIHVSVYTIGFADGTGWRGQLERRDPKSPYGWSPVDRREINNQEREGPRDSGQRLFASAISGSNQAL
jgi:hypothetical protein